MEITISTKKYELYVSYKINISAIIFTGIQKPFCPFYPETDLKISWNRRSAGIAFVPGLDVPSASMYILRMECRKVTDMP